MKNKIEELLKVKSILKYNDNLYIETTNKEKSAKVVQYFIPMVNKK